MTTDRSSTVPPDSPHQSPSPPRRRRLYWVGLLCLFLASQALNIWLVAQTLQGNLG